MLEILTGLLAKLAALGAAGKATAGLTAAAAAVAAAGATGVLPALPEQADRGTVERGVEVAEPDVEMPDTGLVDLPEAPGDEVKGEPAPQASFGQSVAEDAREGGVVGSEIAEQARQQGTDRRADAGRPADLPEQASTGVERSQAGAANGDAGRAQGAAAAEAGAANADAGRETADSAPVEQAPAGTPAEGRIPARR